MKIREILRSNNALRYIGKKINIHKEFHYDAKSFSEFFLESAEKKGDCRYRIMLMVHSLEKGMCMSDPRPYGHEKVLQLIQILSQFPELSKKGFEYLLGVSALHSWMNFFEEHGWQSEEMYAKAKTFLDTVKVDYLETGYRDFQDPSKQFDVENFGKVLFTRHSVRDFQDRGLDRDDIEFAVKCFIEAPTACNRQMCRLIYIMNQEVKEFLDKTIIGTSGFNKRTVRYFIVTYDLAAFHYSGERQQGLFNAGLCTMNFINGLHARGIGACCLQWSNKHSEDVRLRNKLGLLESERIAVVVGTGYYLESSKIPCSVRRNLADIYREKR